MVELEQYNPRISSTVVRWFTPPEGWLKCNTDGASRGNPSPSAIAFCIRNKEGNLLVAKGVKIGETTNLAAKLELSGRVYIFAGRISYLTYS